MSQCLIQTQQLFQQKRILPVKLNMSATRWDLIFKSKGESLLGMEEIKEQMR